MIILTQLYVYSSNINNTHVTCMYLFLELLHFRNHLEHECHVLNHRNLTQYVFSGMIFMIIIQIFDMRLA